MTFSAWCLLHRKTARFSRYSRNGRAVVFCVSFRGDFQGKYSRRAAPKSPLVLRAGQTMPCEIVVFRYRFGVHFCRFPLLSFLPPSLAAFRSPWYARCGQGSSVSLPEVVALHRRGAYPIQAGHSIGIIHR